MFTTHPRTTKAARWRAVFALFLLTAGVVAGVPRAADAAFITGPVSGCLLKPLIGVCPGGNLFNNRATSNLSNPMFIDAQDLLGDTLETAGAYSANFNNTLPGTSDTHLDLSIKAARPLSAISGPLTWTFTLDVGPGSTVGENIARVVPVAGGVGGLVVDAIELIATDTFAVTTSFASLMTGVGVRLRIETGAIPSEVPAPGILLLAVTALALSPFGRRR